MVSKTGGVGGDCFEAEIVDTEAQSLGKSCDDLETAKQPCVMMHRLTHVLDGSFARVIITSRVRVDRHCKHKKRTITGTMDLIPHDFLQKNSNYW